MIRENCAPRKFGAIYTVCVVRLQVHVVLSEVNQEVESEEMKIDPSSDTEGDSEVKVDEFDEEEDLSDTDSEEEWNTPTKV